MAGAGLATSTSAMWSPASAERARQMKKARKNNSAAIAAENQKNDNDENDYAHTAGRSITPIPAMRPSRKGSKKRQNQDHNQDCSKHVLLLFLPS